METEKTNFVKNIGALWAKTANNEKKTRYYSGSIDTKELLEQCGGTLPDKIGFKCFRNFQKVEEKQPDYRILLSVKNPDYQPPVKEVVKATLSVEVDEPSDEQLQPVEGYGLDEIPF